MLLFPEFNPVALQIGPVAVRWYGLAYVVALVLGLLYTRWQARKNPAPGVTPQVFDDLFTWIVLGVVLGGRLGYVLFYAPSYFFAHPLEIFMVWHGGMSFHGGTLGVITALLLFCRKQGLNVFDVADRLVPAVPIGLFLGRIANFINGELVGRPTSADLPWAMIFPQVDLYPRHPSQLYEAGLEGLLLFVLLFLATRKGITRYQPVGIFLTGYGLARIVVETFRTPEITHNLDILTLTQGQLLSLPMVALGLGFLYFAVQTQNPKTLES